MRLWARVSHEGAILASSDDVTSSRSSTGTYVVTFPQSIKECALFADVFNTNDMLATPHDNGVGPDQVQVLVRNVSPEGPGGYYDANFAVAAVC